jgi:hypothetical protein
MRKDRAAQQRLFSGTILRGLTQPLNVIVYSFVIPADITQQAKSAATDGLTYSGFFQSGH